MSEKLTYTAPGMQTLSLELQRRILELSNYGQQGEAGTGFDSGNIIDVPDLF